MNPYNMKDRKPSLEDVRFLLLIGLGLLISFSIKYVNTVKLTYEWYANVTAGSLLPTEHLSNYKIVANLIIYSNGEYYKFQIEDADYSNSAFSLPFEVVYSDDDVSFFGHENDKIWSLNMKKALATLFQIKKNAFMEGAFSTKENNSYGTCDVEYITVREQSRITIKKIINEASCINSPNRQRSNTPLFSCLSGFQEGTTNHNERSYTILRRESPYISEIATSGTTYFQPFQALAEAHYIEVSQFLKLISIVNETNPDDTSSKNASSITYSTESIHIPTFGRFPENNTLLKAEIYQLLGSLTTSLDWKLSTKGLDNQTSFHILELMWWLNVKEWEELYETVLLGTSYSQETIQHFFWDFVPQVGSEASVIFIKNLVLSKRIKGFSASLLLTTFPLHLRQASEKLLIETEDFLRLKDVDMEVQNAGVLSFSVLVQRVCYQSCTKELLDRYTKYCLDMFTETPNYEDQMVYLQALSNMRLARILDFLTPIIKNPSFDRHIRYLAISAMLPTIEKYPRKATEIFWPLFVNNSESLDIRVSALYILIVTQPTASRLLTFFWNMQTESNYHVYNFFFTTIHSFANTKHPCFYEMRRVASQLSRYLLPRAYRWATGNYMIDYEDTVRGYGGLIQMFIVASESTGLPSTIVLSTEQHSHGLNSKFSIHAKLEGVVNTVWETFSDPVYSNTTHFFTTMDMDKFLQNANFSIKIPELVHVELMVKVDDNTIFCKFFNKSTFSDILQSLEKVSALYYEFSVNYQRVRFPLRYEIVKLNDLGTPVTLQIRTASILSLRGSIKQAEKGTKRNAVLDFRYSMNTVTSLKTLNTLNEYWYGTDRTRSLHIRVPFSVHLFEKQKRNFFEITADRHKDFSNDSMQGIVWHSTIKLLPEQNRSQSQINGNNNNQWSIESEDLGARFDAKVFDCQDGNNMVESLHIIKEAFQLSNKNYKMVTGGVPILGLYSLANYFTFIPPGDSCGIIVSMIPLQVQLALISEGTPVHIIMRTEKENKQIWDLKLKSKDIENDGQTQLDFKLEHSNPEKNVLIMNNTWRLIHFEGYIITPSFRQGILNAPSPIKGQARFSWGTTEQVTSVEVALRSDSTADNWPVNCENDTALCWQTVSNQATKQTVILNCYNLPMWMTAALLSIFPDNTQANKTTTKIQFSLPAKFPWTTQGECVVNTNRVLNFDNGTILDYEQQTSCYSIAITDCFSPSQFIIGLKKLSSYQNTLELKVISSYTVLAISTLRTDTKRVMTVNDTIVTIQNYYQFYPPQANSTNHIYQYKYWEKSKMTEIVVGQSELILQYYEDSVVAIASFKLRGRMCGLCGDFNGEISNDEGTFTPCIKDLII